MSNITLEICVSLGNYSLIWVEDGEEGLSIGDLYSNSTDKTKLLKILKNPNEYRLEEWECAKADNVAFTSKGSGVKDGVIYWETMKDAKAALRLVRSAVKRGPQDQDVDPPWAEEALALGWTRPVAKKKVAKKKVAKK